MLPKLTSRFRCFRCRHAAEAALTVLAEAAFAGFAARLLVMLSRLRCHAIIFVFWLPSFMPLLLFSALAADAMPILPAAVIDC